MPNGFHPGARSAGKRSSIRIELGPDPRSRRSRQVEPILIESDTSRLLLDELRRYCRGDVSGRSFLIAGHRGAGKTTMVAGAYHRLLKESSGSDSEGMLRPLFVPLHGPNLIPSESSLGAEGAQAPEPPPAEEPELELEGEPLELELEAPEGEESAGENGAPSSETAAERGLRLALIQITIALYAALAREVARAYRKKMLELEGVERRPLFDRATRPAASEHGLEKAARLKFELDGFPDPARLREYWRQGGFLETGVLFEDRAHKPDQGYLELLALTSANRLYQRVSGTFSSTETRKRQADAMRLAQVGAGKDGEGTDLVTPIASLLTGGAVGAAAGVGAGASALVATLSGILGALGSVGVFRASSSRSRTKSLDIEKIFEADMSLATLDRELPKLIERLQDCGLAPIFVVDELDKIDQLSSAITKMVRRLKKFVAEQACFCFLTDRGYFETIRRKSREEAYPIEYTYFTHQLFVVFRPQDYHAYIREVLTEPSAFPVDDDLPSTSAAQILETRDLSEDQSDLPLLPYILSHRSYMHPIDLRRLLSSLRTEEGTWALRPGVVRTALGFRFDLMIQLAVELVLEDKEFSVVLDRRPEFRRMAHDALYYPSREWGRGETGTLDLSDGNLGRFEEYLLERIRLEVEDRRPGATAEDPPSLPRRDRNQLVAMTRKLCEFLANPERLHFEVEGWRELEPSVLNAIPKWDQRLLEITAVEHVYKWRFDPSGNRSGRPAQATLLGIEDDVGQVEPWAEASRKIREFGVLLDTFMSGAIDFTTLSTQMGVLADSPSWVEVEQAMARLEASAESGEAYPDIESDKMAVVEFEALLERSSEDMALAIAVGSVVGVASSEETFGARTVVGLDAISTFHSLKGLTDPNDKTSVLQDLWAELQEHLPDRPEIGVPATTSPEAWESWLESLRTAKAIEVDSILIRKSGWKVWEERLDGYLASGQRNFGPTLDELFGYAANSRPANLLRPNLDDMTLRTWSKVFLWGLRDVTPRHRFYCPAWAAALAAGELGWGGYLARTKMFPGKTRLRSRSGTDEDQNRIKRLLKHSLSQSPRYAPVLIVRSTRESITDGWRALEAVPALCLRVDELESLPERWLAFLTRHQSPVVVELPWDRATEAVVKRPAVFIGRAEPEGKRPGRFLENPQGLQDLLDAFPELRGPGDVPSKHG